MSRAAIVLTGILAACGGDRSMGLDDAEGTAMGTDGGSAETADGDLKLDVADGDGMTAGDGGVGPGCAGIDFLFVIDKSSSMTKKQENLVASFPGFVEAIENKVAELDANDFNILVTHTDTIGIVNVDPYCAADCDYDDDGFCSLDGTACSFSLDQSCLPTCRADIDDSCQNGESCRDLLPECGACGCTLGAGQVEDKDGAACGVQGSQRYLRDGQPDLAGTFACLAEVGISGGQERQVDAILEAVSAEHNGVDGCNTGFVRDDAILVVTLITDEEDGEVEGPGVPAWNVGSAGTPAEWRQTLLAAKAGDEQALVVLGLIGDRDLPDPLCECDLDDLQCTGSLAEASPNLRELVTSFPQHVIGSVCEPSYDAFLAQAVDLIEQTCEDFVPPEG